MLYPLPVRIRHQIHFKMHSDKRGIKRKLTDNEEDEQHTKPKTKFKDDEQPSDLLSSAFGMSECKTSASVEDDEDLNDKENNELKIDFLKSMNATDEFNNNTPLNDTRDYTSDLNDESNQNNESFNTFLNTSLSQCYVNSNNNRPLTPLPHLNSTYSTTEQPQHDQRTNQSNQSNANSPSTSQQSQPQASQQPNSSPFPTLISNSKLFNSTSLFSAAAIVDTYFSSTTKKSKLEKAKNMNHFRYSLFNKSLTKLNKFCNSSDPNIRNSVLVCNTLKRLERQLRKENIYLHLTANGLAFIKLKNKRNPEQVDYRNLVLDETSQIYVEKSADGEESDDAENENEPLDDGDRFGIDTDLDFNAAKQNDSSCSSDSESDDDEDDDGLDEEDDEFCSELGNELSNQLVDQDSSPFLESSTVDSSLCNNELINSDLSTYLTPITTSSLAVNNSSDSLVNSTTSTIISSPQLHNEWTADEQSNSNQFNWTNMFTNLTCRDSEQFDSNFAVLNSTVVQSPEHTTSIVNTSKELVDNSSFLFNSIDQSVIGQASTEELFCIDSLITMYDFDLSASVDNSTKSLNELEQETIPMTMTDDNETKCSNSSEDSCDTTLYELDSAIGSINSSMNDSINSSLASSSSPLNNSISNTLNSNTNATSCSTSSSASFASNQANNTISPVIS